MLGPLEIEAATFERDLIVTGARRRDAAGLVAAGPRAAGRPGGPRSRAAGHCRGVHRPGRPAPRYAVPDVDALGRCRTPRRSSNLTCVGWTRCRALWPWRRRRTAGALHEHAELDGRLEAYRAKAVATGVARGCPTSLRRTSWPGTPWTTPTKMALARQLVALYQTYLQTTPAPARPHQATSAEEAMIMHRSPAVRVPSSMATAIVCGTPGRPRSSLSPRPSPAAIPRPRRPAWREHRAPSPVAPARSSTAYCDVCGSPPAAARHAATDDQAAGTLAGTRAGSTITRAPAG